jgi:hypothetical protein
MIIDTGRFIYFNKTPHLRKLYILKLLGVKPQSYIGQVMNRIYGYFFKNSYLLKREYNRFYKKEFNSFQDFLERKHNLFKSEIDVLNYNKAFCSEKQNVEQYRAAELLQDYYDDNVIKDAIFNIFNIEELQSSGENYFDED